MSCYWEVKSPSIRTNYFIEKSCSLCGPWSSQPWTSKWPHKTVWLLYIVSMILWCSAWLKVARQSWKLCSGGCSTNSAFCAYHTQSVKWKLAVSTFSVLVWLGNQKAVVTNNSISTYYTCVPVKMGIYCY